MKTVDEMIAVMTAYKEGKQIEFRGKSTIVSLEWKAVDDPIWDWDSLDYRVKPDPKYVPYDSVLEVDRDKWIARKSNGLVSRLRAFAESAGIVLIDNRWLKLNELFEHYTYEDGTPCGKLAEEVKKKG